MRGSRKCIISALFALIMMPAHAQASVAFSDNFEADAVGDTPPAGWTLSSSSSFTVSVVADSTAGGANAMDLTQTTTSSRRVGASFANSVSLAPGDSLQLGFNVWFVGTVPSLDRLFRFGVYNSDGTGITGRIGTGSSDPGTTYMDIYDSPGIFDVTAADGAKQIGNDKTDSSAVISNDDLHYVTLTITRSADGNSMDLIDAIGSSLNSTSVSAGGNDTTLNDSTFAFDQLAIGINSSVTGGAEYRIDNVKVTYTPAPEPASLTMLGMFALLAPGYRRR